MKFSVIIPVYNKAATICAAVESVYAQSEKDYEIIIVDDGSTDEADKALLSLSRAEFRLIRQKNGGVSVARNTGIENATGEYICFLDADDLWLPNHLEVLAGLISRYPDSGMYVTSHKCIMPDGRVLHSAKALENYDSEFESDDMIGLLNKTSYGVVHTNSMCVRASSLAHDNIRFAPGVRIGEDTDVWYRVALRNKVALSSEETTIYRQELSTATANGSHIQAWIFAGRVSEIMSDGSISEKIKTSVTELTDRYYLTCSREYMTSGERKKAKEILASIKNKRTKRYLLTRILTFMPYSFCRYVMRTYHGKVQNV